MSATMLLPPSKRKAEGGDGPAYGAGPAHAGRLAGARTMLMDAVSTEVPVLDDAAVARICGVRSAEVGWARELLAGVVDAPTMRASRRYTGVVFNNAALDGRAPSTSMAVLIVSPLMGLVAPGEPVPMYRLEFSASLPHHGSIAGFWRAQAGDVLATALAAGPVWDLLPGEHARIWRGDAREHPHHHGFRFVRSDGRAANAARTKLLKGRVAKWLLDHPAAGPHDLTAGLELPDGWATAEAGRGDVTFTEA